MTREEKLIERLEQIAKKIDQAYDELLTIDQGLSKHLADRWIEEIRRGKDSVVGANYLIRKTLRELFDDQNSDLST